jgi:S-(hydroxymethyl)glutathione dehydrogenase / alcohol dehydrogenase
MFRAPVEEGSTVVVFGAGMVGLGAVVGARTFEATGLVGVMRQAVESARVGWGTCCVTGVAGKGETLDIVPRLLITGRKVLGASLGGVKGRDQVPLLVDRYLAGDIDVDSFISHRITLDDVNRGFDLMHHQDGIRSVISYS